MRNMVLVSWRRDANEKDIQSHCGVSMEEFAEDVPLVQGMAAPERCSYAISLPQKVFRHSCFWREGRIGKPWLIFQTKLRIQDVIDHAGRRFQIRNPTTRHSRSRALDLNVDTLLFAFSLYVRHLPHLYNVQQHQVDTARQIKAEVRPRDVINDSL